MARKLRRLRIVQRVRSILFGTGFIGILGIGMIVDCPDWAKVDIACGICMAILLVGVLLDYLISRGVFAGNLDYKTIMDWNNYMWERPTKMRGHQKYYKWLKDYQLLDTDHNFQFFCRRYVHKGTRTPVTNKVV